MGAIIHPLVAETLRVASANLSAILRERAMKKADLARLVAAADGPTKKTVYNIFEGKPPRFENIVHLAEALDVPPWTLFLPSLSKHSELLKPGALKNLATVVENYLESTAAKRTEIEAVAAAAAVVSRLQR